MNATALQSIYKNRVQASGQLLTVTRPRLSATCADTTSTVYFLPQPLNTTGGGNFNMEATLNVGEDNPYDFVASGDSDVAENDRISYNGFLWRVLNTNPQMMAGTAVSLHCYAVREQVSA